MFLEGALGHLVGPDRVRRNARLADLTTFCVGGLADWLVDVRTSDELINVLRIAREARVPATILGGGSNVLVSDAGIRGLVVRPHGGRIVMTDARLVQADAGVTLNALVRWTISRGLSGLETWAGTPGTVGGAVAGNAHYGGRSIGELVDHVRIVTPGGSLADVPRAKMAFGYDHSRLRTAGETLVWAAFTLDPHADPGRLRAVARQSLEDRKRTQPLDRPSAGCIFQNPDPTRDAIPAGIPCSAGALIDRAGLKGRRFGGARISEAHANFIVNDGGATAGEIVALIRLCQREVSDRFGVSLSEEIVYLGSFNE